jgi:hypothetical protein
MATALRQKAYPGVQLLAAASIEANSVEQARLLDGPLVSKIGLSERLANICREFSLTAKIGLSERLAKIFSNEDQAA